MSIKSSVKLTIAESDQIRERHNSKKAVTGTDEPQCTYSRTKTSYSHQPFYRCRRCFKGPHEGVCGPCARKCHQEHGTVFAGNFSAFCDCGLQSCKMSCEIGSKCTFDLYQKTGKKQDWYQCHSCWGPGESQFGCCEVCAEECHKGHQIVYKGLSSDGAVCDCGDNKHKSDVCTFHVTGSQHILQPFYFCSYCFTDIVKEGCCYQCMKTCHAGHRIVLQGNIKAFCDCGLKCCKTACKIQKP